MPAQRVRPWTEAEDKRLLRMLREGFDRSTIAEALGRSPETVWMRKRKLFEELSAEGGV